MNHPIYLAKRSHLPFESFKIQKPVIIRVQRESNFYRVEEQSGRGMPRNKLPSRRKENLRVHIVEIDEKEKRMSRKHCRVLIVKKVQCFVLI